MAKRYGGDAAGKRPALHVVTDVPRPNAATAQVHYFGLTRLVEMLQLCSPEDTVDIMRQRYVPVEHPSGMLGCVVTDQTSFAAAIAQNRRIVGWTRQQDLAAALQSVFATEIVDDASYGLSRAMPRLSADHQLTGSQIAFGAVATIMLLAGLWLYPRTGFPIAAIVCSLLFLSVTAVRAASLFHCPPNTVTDTVDLKDPQLPIYTILVPLFREIEVLDQLIPALQDINYPAAKLDIKLVLEQEDFATRRRIGALDLPVHFEILIVPRTSPQTKPKALNYALKFARGELVTVYDAEDIPDPGQLRMAAEAFAAAPQSLACLQARLAFYNSNENWLTRQFTIEYAALFDLLLPMLANCCLPMPLGGTSNHFRVSVLRRIGGWDAHNVTEDADLGLRLARFGWRVGVISSTTHEEANCQLDNWLNQRARWLKGWMQTWLVHMRSPLRLWQELGGVRFLISQTMMLGMIVTALLHPVFLAYAIWALISGAAFEAAPSIMSSLLMGFGLVVLATGYGFAIAAGAKALIKRGLGALLLSVAGMPLYWLLISLGGWLALWQLISSPHHWNKTRHGQSRVLCKVK